MSERKTYILLDNIRSAYNVGSIFRTADGAGNCHICICGISPTPENPKVLKTSLGADKTVPWNYYEDTNSALNELSDKNIPIYAIENHSKSIDYRDVIFPLKSAIILGNEKNGVGEEILEKVNNIIEIPMAGKKNSLNVAVCAGIILYKINE